MCVGGGGGGGEGGRACHVNAVSVHQVGKKTR